MELRRKYRISRKRTPQASPEAGNPTPVDALASKAQPAEAVEQDRLREAEVEHQLLLDMHLNL